MGIIVYIPKDATEKEIRLLEAKVYGSRRKRTDGIMKLAGKMSRLKMRPLEIQRILRSEWE
jgi:hypothetical protein